jgi:hypothetical protein
MIIYRVYNHRYDEVYDESYYISQEMAKRDYESRQNIFNRTFEEIDVNTEVPSAVFRKNIEDDLLSRAKERYQETKKLVGVNSYGAGYELGYIEALEDVLQILGVPYPEINEQLRENVS